jgi:hypothetical protein
MFEAESAAHRVAVASDGMRYWWGRVGGRPAMTVEWQRWPRAAHPTTGEPVFMGDFVVTHARHFDASPMYSNTPDRARPSQVAWGDGQPMTREDMRTIQASAVAAAADGNTVQEDAEESVWDPGDILLVDNWSVWHSPAPHSGAVHERLLKLGGEGHDVTFGSLIDGDQEPEYAWRWF